MSEIFENDRLDSLRLMRLLYKKRLLLVVVGALAFFGSIFVTSFIPPKFFSNGIIYPTASNDPKEVLANPRFGHEQHADYMMQILESENVRDSIIKQFDLIEYYELDTNSIDWEYKLHKQFTNDVTFFRSKYMSIVISATTKDAELSADIVNAIIDIADVRRESVFKPNAFKAFKNIEANYLKKANEVDVLVDSIHFMQLASTNVMAGDVYQSMKTARNAVRSEQNAIANLQKDHNIFNLQQQQSSIGNKLMGLETHLAGLKGKRDILIKNYAEKDTIIVNIDAEVSALLQEQKIWKEQLGELSNIQSKWNDRQEQLTTSSEQLSKLRTEYATLVGSAEPTIKDVRVRYLETLLESEQVQLAELKVDYEMALAAYEQPLPEVYQIDRAKPSFKKVSPSYSFNAIIGTIGSVVFCILILVFWDRFSKLKADALKEEA